MIEDITKIPKRNAKDVVHGLVKVGLSAIPIPGVGGLASELFSQVITPSITNRRDKWLESVAKRLKDLEDKFENFKIEDLQENEAFVSTVIQASRIAIANHQKEKREALQNAVLKSALPDAIADDLQLMFLNYIDFFTPMHLRMLKFFNEFKPKHLPTREGTTELFFLSNKGEKKLSLRQAFPNPAFNDSTYNQVLIDLRTRGLISPNGADLPRFSDIVKYEVNITRLGQQFLDFITSPIESIDENNTE